MTTQEEGRAGATGVATVPGLAEAMRDLAEAMAQAEGLRQTAQVVADAAVALIPGVEQASVSLARRGVGIDTLAASGDLPLRADAAQVEAGEGPCIEAAWEHDIARLNDTRTDRQWPVFSRRAHDLGVASMLSVQLSLPQREDGDTRIGAVNTYAGVPDAFDHVADHIALVLAVHAAVGIGQAEREEQLRVALDSRDVIGQAKGLIMAQQGVSAGTAFDLLVRQSRDSNTRLRDLAQGVVEAHEVRAAGAP